MAGLVHSLKRLNTFRLIPALSNSVTPSNAKSLGSMEHVIDILTWSKMDFNFRGDTV